MRHQMRILVKKDNKKPLALKHLEMSVTSKLPRVQAAKAGIITLTKHFQLCEEKYRFM